MTGGEMSQTDIERKRDCVDACIGIEHPRPTIQEALLILRDVLRAAEAGPLQLEELGQFVGDEIRPRCERLFDRVHMDERALVIPKITREYVRHLTTIDRSEQVYAYLAMTSAQLERVSQLRAELELPTDHELYLMAGKFRRRVWVSNQ